jgi:hypothetical protein
MTVLNHNMKGVSPKDQVSKLAVLMTDGRYPLEHTHTLTLTYTHIPTHTNTHPHTQTHTWNAQGS